MIVKIITYVKNRVKGIVFGRTRLGDFVNSLYDLIIFYKYSFFKERFNSKGNHRAYLIKQYHIIEKGLSLPFPRPNFGLKKIQRLIGASEKYERKYGSDSLLLAIKSCLLEYAKSNPKLETEFHREFNDIIDFIGDFEDDKLGGTRKLSSREIQIMTNIQYENFVKTRTSVRNFAEKDLAVGDIITAVSMARFSPSVCNRQAWKAHYFDDQDRMNQLLKLQAGNSGFTESIKGLIIVTSNLKYFTKLERNQVYTDGGIFSMNLILALHSMNIASCCLNTNLPFTTEKRIKNIADIPNEERLIMMIAIGYYKENFKVALSNKKDINDILTIH